ncbi:MAG: riboflavin synthase [Pseudomonadota bacterium]
MFTGIIQSVGRLLERRDHGGDCTLAVEHSGLRGGPVGIGDSIANNGVCLTVTAIDGNRLEFDVSGETLALTSLGQLEPGSGLNMEAAATPDTALGGHIVSGHVDGMATVTARTADARSVRFEFEVPDALARYLAPKGSICVDGVSLTVNGVEGRRFDVNIVPHTLAETIFDSYTVGSMVNLEVDVIARYVERLLQAREERT